MLGPVMAGALITQSGYETTWLVTALLAALAVVLMTTGRILLLRHVRATAGTAERPSVPSGGATPATG
jgi:hypothetical protein